MRTSRRIGRPLVALAVFALVALLRATGLLTSLEFYAADARARLLRHEVASDIVIVGIDAQSLSRLSDWPWPRRNHAAVIRELNEGGPRQLFIDIDFSSHQTAQDDAELEAALAAWQGRNVILPAFFQPATSADSELLRTEPLATLARHVDLAAVNLSTAQDGRVRRVRTIWGSSAQQLVSVPALAAHSVLDGEREPLIDFSISPASFAYVSYVDVLEGRIDPAEFTGKTVYLGATAVELGDMVSVPVYKSLPGVVVLALATETLRTSALTELPLWGNLLVLALAGLACAWSLGAREWRRNAAAFGIYVAIAVTLWLASYALLRVQIELVPSIAFAIVTFLFVTLRSLDRQTWRALVYAVGARRRGALLKSVVESSHDCILCLDAAGVVRTANPAAARLFGCSHDSLLGAPIAQFIPALPAELGELASDSFEVLAGAISEWEACTSLGKTFPVELSISRVHLQERLFTAIVRDISERKAHERKLEYQATHDPLTSLPNRAALNTQLNRTLAGKAAVDSAALLMLDLSRFKEVNDTLGHNIGDRVLCEVSQRFQRTIGAEGFLARIGGDEFTVVLAPAADRATVERVAHALSDCLRAPIQAGGVAIDIGVSIGVARFPQDSRDADALLKYADVAMYVAKRRGSTCELYDAALDEYTLRKLTMVSELRAAIGTSALSLHYQPQVNLHTGKCESAEALLRWKHATLGAVSPAEFMAVAETTDLIQPLTEWTVTEGLNQIRRWRQRGLELRVAVNLSARILQDTAFPARLRTLLESSGVRPQQLELEITESAMMQDAARALAVIRQIHELGVAIAIDDYGTGFSSLAYLRDLPVHALKLDKSFVMNMRAREDDRVIVHSTAQLAHALGLQVVAEGVESEWEAQFLREAGYDFAQGYHFNRALPAAECFLWMQKFNAAVTAASAEPSRQTAA